jgi:crossover junction endodeoxyribonuclease RuvC
MVSKTGLKATKRLRKGTFRGGFEAGLRPIYDMFFRLFLRRRVWDAKIRPENACWPMFAFRANPEKTKRAGGRMRVIGIDPGLNRTGWGIVDATGAHVRLVAHGTCATRPGDLAERLLSLHVQLSEVLASYRPEAAAVEQTFVNSNGAATLKLGQARAIALLVPAAAGLKVAEYAPNAVKKVVVGVGHAAKEQVAHMVRMQLPDLGAAGPDATDALAIALCHAHHVQFAGRLDAALSRAEARP